MHTQLLKLTLAIFISVYATASYSQDQFDGLLIVDSIEQTMLENHYNPSELESQAYKTILQQTRDLARTSENRQAFITAFNELWRDGPFSHVRLSEAQGSAEQLAVFLDQMNVGEGAIQLSWDNDIAIMTINTMMGQDTIKAIPQMYQAMSEQNPRAIIIDLRQNEGGAFAIRPLISHLIKQPHSVGYFISQNWNSNNSRLPSIQKLQKTAGWEGWSISSFWQDVSDKGLIKVNFQPTSPTITANVYILTSRKTASAAELATDALQSIGRATVIGEPTAGEMLSQKPFDIATGLHLFLPIADYYSLTNGRLEGNPIQPDIIVSADEAMSVAKQQINPHGND